MIVDSLDNTAAYVALHPGFKAAFEYLKRADLAAMADSRVEIDGKRLYVMTAHSACKSRQAAALEVHRKYIDIQVPLNMSEEMGWSPLRACETVTQAYDQGRDVGFFGDAPRSWVTVAPGDFIVFFPNDAHAPLVGSGTSHKVVVKVAVDW